ncbi:MAG: hypothetical protein EPO23_14840 [Xanthobacteraceae bacterium]|nr:MAG: hypothetical protein EPO23_14840 [Xanthobacteraceae bacterium]
MATGLLLAITALAWLSGWTAAAPANVTLLYVGAEDCAPCNIWQNNQEPAFRQSAEFSRLAYREVKSPALFDLLKDDYWPEDLRAYRQVIGKGAGAPLWLVIADGRIVMQRSGLTQWQEAVLPKIKSLLR